jgi:predicted nucleic acid-binding protein
MDQLSKKNCTLGHLDLLRVLYDQLLIPTAVCDEVVGSSGKRAGQAEVRDAKWIETCIVHDKAAVQLLRERLEAGESEAIMLAIETHAALLLIDETEGRRIAESRGIHHIGTVGTVIELKNVK